MDPAQLNAIVFNQKPRRVFKAAKNENLPFNDAKRVHTALREFNDLSANAAFKNILAQIESQEMKFDFAQKKPRGSVAGQGAATDFFEEKSARSGTMAGQQPSFSADQMQFLLDNEDATEEDIVKNVELMLNAEKRMKEKSQRGVPKQTPASAGFDLNSGMLEPIRAEGTQGKKVNVPQGMSLQD